MNEMAATTLGEAIADLAADLDALDGRGLAQRLQDLERLARRVEHAIVGVVRAADRAGAWVEDGHRSVRGWCQATVNWSSGDTTHRLRTVTLLDDLPPVDKALAAGEVGVAQVRELARARANPRCGAELVDCQDVLLDQAQTLPCDEFRISVGRWEANADSDGAHRDHELAHQNRRLSLTQLGAEWLLRGEGGAVHGAILNEILDAFTNAEFQADWDDARQRLGVDNPGPLDLARTARQRRWDALVAIFLAAASRHPGSPAPEPVVDIIVDQATFEAALAAIASGQPIDGFIPDDTDPTSRRCETIHGVPVDPLDAAVAALIGRVRRVVYNSKSCVIDLGVSSRLYRGAARSAVWLQGTRCSWPGCGHPHCQIDHCQPWTDHGHTNPDNAAPLCGHHNRWKTRGYTTWRDPNGRWHTHRPDGTEIRAA